MEQRVGFFVVGLEIYEKEEQDPLGEHDSCPRRILFFKELLMVYVVDFDLLCFFDRYK